MAELITQHVKVEVTVDGDVPTGKKLDKTQQKVDKLNASKLTLKLVGVEKAVQQMQQVTKAAQKAQRAFTGVTNIPPRGKPSARSIKPLPRSHFEKQRDTLVYGMRTSNAKTFLGDIREGGKRIVKLKRDGEQLAKKVQTVRVRALTNDLNDAGRKIKTIRRDGELLAKNVHTIRMKSLNDDLKESGKRLNKSKREAGQLISNANRVVAKERAAIKAIDRDIAKQRKSHKLRTEIPLDLYDRKQAVGMYTPKQIVGGGYGNVRAYGLKSSEGAKQIAQAYTPVAKLQQEMQKLHRVTNNATSGMRNFADGLTTASKASKGAMFNFFRTRAIIAAIASAGLIAGGAIKKWFDISSDYAEANHLLYATLVSSLRDVDDSLKTAELTAKDVFGNKIPNEVLNVTQEIVDANAKLEKFASDMMLDPTSVKRTYANFYELAVSAGVAYDKIATMSQGMTQLTYDLASLNDLPFEDVQKKLHSGLSGVTSAVRSLGPDISRTAADAWLLANGFDATYNSLTRDNKMIVIYNMLMEHTATAQGDLARSALQPANSMRILGEQARVAARQLGGALFPFVTQLVPVFILLAQAVQAAAAALAGFFTRVFGGIGGWYDEELKNWNSYLKGLQGGIGGGGGGIADDLDDIGNAAGGAGKKLKELRDFQLGFDELHVLPDQPDAGGGGGGGGGGAGGGGIDIPIAPAYPYGDSIWGAIEEDATATMERIKIAIDKAFDPGTADAFISTVKGMYDVTIEQAELLWQETEGLRQFIDEHWDWVDVLENIYIWYARTMKLATKIAGGFAKTITPVLEMGTELPVVGKGFEFLLDIMDGGVGAIIGVTLAFKVLLGPLKFLKFLGKPVGKAIGAVGTAAKWVGGKLKPLGGKLKDLGGKFDKTKGKAKGLAGKTGLGKLGEAFKKSGDDMAKFGLKAGGLDGVMAKAGEAGFPKFIGAFGKLFGIAGIPAAIKNGFDVIGDDIIPGGLDRWQTILESDNPFEEYKNQIGDYAFNGDFIDQMLGLGLWDGAFDDIKNGFSGLSSDVTSNIDRLKNKSRESWLGIRDNMVNNSRDAKDKTIAAFKNIEFDVGSSVSTTEDNTTSGFGAMQRDVKLSTNDMNSTSSLNLSNMATKSYYESLKLRNHIKNNMASAKSDVDWYTNKMHNSIGATFPHPHIPIPHFTWSTKKVGPVTLPSDISVEWYKKGGLFNNASLIGVGEAGPEAVVPLSGQRMQPFAEAVGKNISGNESIDPDVLAQKISTAVYNAMIKGFPKDIKTDVYLDSTKVNDELRRNDRIRGVGTSIIA